VARLFTTDIQPMRTHVLDDIAVADLGAVQLQLHVAEEAFEAEIGHHRRDDATAGQPPALVPGLGDQRHDLVAVDDRAILVDDDDASASPSSAMRCRRALRAPSFASRPDGSSRIPC